MRRRKTVVGIALFLAANLVSCSDLPTPTAASRTRVPSSPLLDAGVDLRDTQIAARHADPRTTMRSTSASSHQPRPPSQLHPGRLHVIRHMTVHRTCR